MAGWGVYMLDYMLKRETEGPGPALWCQPHRSLSTPVRHSWKLIREQSPVMEPPKGGES